jgi:hypothetical protein
VPHPGDAGGGDTGRPDGTHTINPSFSIPQKKILRKSLLQDAAFLPSLQNAQFSARRFVQEYKSAGRTL